MLGRKKIERREREREREREGGRGGEEILGDFMNDGRMLLVGYSASFQRGKENAPSATRLESQPNFAVPGVFGSVSGIGRLVIKHR